MRKHWLVPLIFLIVFVAFWTVRENAFKKPPEDPKIIPPSVIPKDMDLAGGTEREVRGFPKREIVDLISKYPGLFIASGEDKDEKIVALTFDDGPDDTYTPPILDVLKAKGVRATFFIIGKRAEGYSEVMQRIVDESHLLGNHSWSHPDIMKLPLDKMKEEVLKTDEKLKSYYKDTKCYKKLFRSPYGSIDPKRVEFLGDLGYKIISWNVDSLDWKGLSAEEVKTNVLENVTNNSIILQHSAGGQGEDLSGTVEALPEIIDVLKKEGYKFVTVDELLSDK
ncbi:MAG: polysaccharide deacetylase family protein [Tepidanaerobacteraceae bacterium]